MFSIDDHVVRMAELHPQFEVKIATDWLVVFEGWLSPFRAQKYKVRITMCMFHDIEAGEIQGHAPRVEVIEPSVRPAPHLYKNEINPDYALLCLYDPAQRQWTYSDLIAETTVPWAVRWLASYEGWLATKEWTGGGRDHDPDKEVTQTCQDNKKTQNDQPVRFNKSVFNSLGRKIGTYASFPLMVAASKGSFQPLSWRNWKRHTSVANPLGTTSTTSAALRLVA